MIRIRADAFLPADDGIFLSPGTELTICAAGLNVFSKQHINASVMVFLHYTSHIPQFPHAFSDFMEISISIIPIKSVAAMETENAL